MALAKALENTPPGECPVPRPHSCLPPSSTCPYGSPYPLTHRPSALLSLELPAKGWEDSRALVWCGQQFQRECGSPAWQYRRGSMMHRTLASALGQQERTDTAPFACLQPHVASTSYEGIVGRRLRTQRARRSLVDPSVQGTPWCQGYTGSLLSVQGVPEESVRGVGSLPYGMLGEDIDDGDLPRLRRHQSLLR